MSLRERLGIIVDGGAAMDFYDAFDRAAVLDVRRRLRWRERLTWTLPELLSGRRSIASLVSVRSIGLRPDGTFEVELVPTWRRGLVDVEVLDIETDDLVAMFTTDLMIS